MYMNDCYLAEIQKMPLRFYTDCSPTNTTHYICYHTGRTAVQTNMNSYFPEFESRNQLSITISLNLSSCILVSINNSKSSKV